MKTVKNAWKASESKLSLKAWAREQVRKGGEFGGLCREWLVRKGNRP